MFAGACAGRGIMGAVAAIVGVLGGGCAGMGDPTTAATVAAHWKPIAEAAWDSSARTSSSSEAPPAAHHRPHPLEWSLAHAHHDRHPPGVALLRSSQMKMRLLMMLLRRL